jgi:hypothetical protein
MTNLDAMTDEEREQYGNYLEQAKRAGGPLGMAERRDSNSGRPIHPSDLLIRQAPANSHTEYVDAVFSK